MRRRRATANCLPSIGAMKLQQPELDKIAALTLAQYNQRAQDFWEGTRGHDVAQNIAALLRYIEGETPFTIIDLGCGPRSGHRRPRGLPQPLRGAVSATLRRIA